MFGLQFCSRLSTLHLLQLHCSPSKPFLFFLILRGIRTHTSAPEQSPQNLVFYNYLVEAFNFPRQKALTISNRFGQVRTLEKPLSVVNFLKSLGFSEPQIRSSVNVCPQILIADVHKNLGPKLRYFQELGFSVPHLGKFISKYSSVLTYSLDGSLRPCIDLIKEILGSNGDDKDIIRVFSRCNWIGGRASVARLRSNVLYLKSCGISDTQLAIFLKRQPRLFTRQESTLRGIVESALEMGFVLDSGMLVHGIYTVSCMSRETIERKLELFKSFGFSKDEGMEMFRRAPAVLRTSEAKLRFAMEFLLGTVKLKRSDILNQPCCLGYNMEDRVVARYRVLKIVKSKRLLKKEPRFLNVVHLPEGKFLAKYISSFSHDAEELLVAYKAHLLESSTEEKV